MKHFYTTVYLGLLLIFNTFLLLSVQAQEPVISFSYPGGFYDTPLVLRLSCSDSLSIHYTINGNNPKCSDLKYQHPLILNEDLFTSSNIYTIQTCHDSLWYPVTSIQKCIVIRASAFNSKGKQVGETTTNSYFIKSLGCDSHNLPIVSICTDSVSLFDQKFGIMAINITKEIDFTSNDNKSLAIVYLTLLKNNIILYDYNLIDVFAWNNNIFILIFFQRKNIYFYMI